VACLGQATTFPEDIRRGGNGPTKGSLIQCTTITSNQEVWGIRVFQKFLQSVFKPCSLEERKEVCLPRLELFQASRHSFRMVVTPVEVQIVIEADRHNGTILAMVASMEWGVWWLV
jgi:hypothetical protein